MKMGCHALRVLTFKAVHFNTNPRLDRRREADDQRDCVEFVEDGHEILDCVNLDCEPRPESLPGGADLAFDSELNKIRSV